MIALIGNPNAGKTTIFNMLTNSSEPTGNFSGVTVEKKIGRYKDYSIVDLPGIYSLIPYTKEEEVTVEFIKNNKISLIINVIDINKLNRSLYLTSRLMDLNIPMIIMVTKVKGTKVNIELLKRILGINIIVASKKIDYHNLGELLNDNNNNKDYHKFNIYDDIKTDIEKRYEKIDEICSKVIISKKNNKIRNIIDSILTNKYLSLMISVLLFIFIYYVSINIIGSKLVSILSNNLNRGIIYISKLIDSTNTSIIFKDLITKGILKGISNIISFIPLIIILTFIISLLEDSGYITRMSLILDKFLRIIGLSGKSFSPLLTSSTCSVLGIMSTRTIKDKKERLKTIFLIPFIPCSAKLTLIIYITTVFYHNSFLIFLSFYLVCILVLIITSLLFKKTKSSYIIEIPNLKIPSIRIALKSTYDKVKSYLFRIITVILFISIINFFLISFDTSFNYKVSYNNSILYLIGCKISNIFKLFGIKESVAIITGFMAKEQVVSTLSVLGNNLNKVSAYLFCIFNIITIPCINTVVALKNECGYKLMIIYSILYLVISYVVVMLIYLFFIFCLNL